jgi:hypothetical protein
MRRLSGAKVEIGLATMAYNHKRMTNVLGATNRAISLILRDGRPRAEGGQVRCVLQSMNHHVPGML